MKFCFVLINYITYHIHSFYRFDRLTTLAYNTTQNGTLTYNKAVRGFNIQYKLPCNNNRRVTREREREIIICCCVLFWLFVCLFVRFAMFWFLLAFLHVSFMVNLFYSRGLYSKSFIKLTQQQYISVFQASTGFNHSTLFKCVYFIARNVITIAIITINDSYCPLVNRQHSWASARKCLFYSKLSEQTHTHNLFGKIIYFDCFTFCPLSGIIMENIKCHCRRCSKIY